jgi:putative transcriptional regulator
MVVPSLRGKLIVATPALGDPNFERTVVLVLEHGAQGALGIVLNRPTDTPLSEAVSDWAPLASAPAVVYLGGPVGIGTIIALGRAADEDDAPPGTEPVTGTLVAVDLSTDPEALVSRLTDLRVWTGYAGWAGGQLEAELAQEAWFVVDADVADATTSDPGALWRAVLGRQPGTLAWFSNFPEDPAQN